MTSAPSYPSVQYLELRTSCCFWLCTSSWYIFMAAAPVPVHLTENLVNVMYFAARPSEGKENEGITSILVCCLLGSENNIWAMLC